MTAFQLPRISGQIDELNLHFNTVKYRVGRAIARRGREVAADRLDVEVALLACHWYGAAVLRQEGACPPAPSQHAAARHCMGDNGGPDLVSREQSDSPMRA